MPRVTFLSNGKPKGDEPSGRDFILVKTHFPMGVNGFIMMLQATYNCCSSKIIMSLHLCT